MIHRTKYCDSQWNLFRTQRGRPLFLKGNLKNCRRNQVNYLYLSIICFYQIVMSCFFVWAKFLRFRKTVKTTEWSKDNEFLCGFSDSYCRMSLVRMQNCIKLSMHKQFLLSLNSHKFSWFWEEINITLFFTFFLDLSAKHWKRCT